MGLFGIKSKAEIAAELLAEKEARDKASREARISMLHLLLTEDSVYLGTKQGLGKYQVAYDAKDEETVVELQNLEL